MPAYPLSAINVSWRFYHFNLPNLTTSALTNVTVLQSVSLKPWFCKRILALYSNPSVKVKVNGFLIEELLIHNGTRQGCSLSPLIYILTFLCFLEAHSYLKGFDIAGREYKLAHADDMLLLLRKPHMCLPGLESCRNAWERHSCTFSTAGTPFPLATASCRTGL